MREAVILPKSAWLPMNEKLDHVGFVLLPAILPYPIAPPPFRSFGHLIAMRPTEFLISSSVGLSDARMFAARTHRYEH